jgi:hypothetical protein
MENGITLTLSGVQIGLTLAVLGVVLREHKVWVRLKDRVNTLWQRHCATTGDAFIPLENGK